MEVVNIGVDLMLEGEFGVIWIKIGCLIKMIIVII